MKKVKIEIVIFMIIAIGFFLYYKEGTLPVNREDQTYKIFVIKKGESLISITKELANEGFIRNKIVFYLVTKQLGIDKDIQAGDFRLSTSMDAFRIARSLTHGTLDTWVTLIEGTRKEEMAQVLAKNIDIPVTEFIKNTNEGYLFPDTYLIPHDATVGAIIKILADNFNRRYSENLRAKVRAEGLTTDQVITVASLVEKEARTDNDRPEVAGIILKRWKAGWQLQIDATIQYALGYQVDENTWWKKDLSADDLKIDSPYNTYVNTGLPPGPICNPGLSSITAVVNADTSTPYWFYISDKQGRMHYAVTNDQQDTNKKEYLQ